MYAIIEYIPGEVRVTYRNLPLLTANNVVQAWNYQLGAKRGWMERVEDDADKIATRVAELREFDSQRER